MTLDGFLTFLTLVLGALTFMSPVMRLRLRLALGLWVLWSLLGLVAVLYFEFFHIAGLLCPGALGGICGPLEMRVPPDAGPSSLTPMQAAFLVVLIWLAATWLGMVRPKVHSWSLGTLARLVTRLINERRFSEALDLIEPNLESVDVFASRRGSMQRLYDALTPKPWQMTAAMKAHLQRRAAKRSSKGSAATAWPFDLADPSEAAAGKPSWRERLTYSCGPWIARGIPSGASQETAAAEVLRSVLTRREVIDYIAEQRPVFGARLLPLEHHLSSEFSDRFLSLLIERPGSALYEEVENSQNLFGCSYFLPADASILHSLLDDARVAQRLNAYDPVPRRVIAMLNPINDPEYAPSLNTAWDYRFAEQGIWQDPTFVSIRYLDLIVRAAACQDIEDHMWVYYLDHLAEALEERYDDRGPHVDLHAEWPIRSSRMLYAIVDVLVDWIRLAEKVPAGSSHATLDNMRIDRGTANIPKAAAVTLGDMIKLVTMSTRIDERFKVYLLDVAIRWLRDCGPKRKPDWVRAVTIAAIAQGGTIDGGDGYRAALCDLYEQVDRPWHKDFEDFETAIGFPRRATVVTALAPAQPDPVTTVETATFPLWKRAARKLQFWR